MIQTKETTFPKYPAYKNSGVEWLGEIPEGWEVNRLKSSITLLTGYPFKSEKYVDMGVKLARGINVKEGYFDWTELRCWPEVTKELESFLLKEGDILISMDGSKVGKNFCQVKKDDLPILLLQRVARLRTKNRLTSNFLYWNIVCRSFLSWVSISKTDPMVPHIAPKDINNFIIAYPPLPEQTAIAAFLDNKTAKIDRAIAQKEQLIALLKERRQIVIQNAVTGKTNCLNQDAQDDEMNRMEDGEEKNPAILKSSKSRFRQMKDSGVEWIGEIPEGWEVKRFRYVFNLGKGLTITKENLQDEGVACVNYGEIHSKYGFEVNPEFHELKCVDEEYLKSSPNALLKQGDFVFADTSEDIEGSGNFTYLNSNRKTFAGYHTVIARPKRIINSRFLAYSFDSPSFRNQIRNRVKGVKVYSITQSILSEPKVWLPTLEEQNSIVDYLDNKCPKYHLSIQQQLKQIEKLKEYKVSLIDSAVTGKIKVV